MTGNSSSLLEYLIRFGHRRNSWRLSVQIGGKFRFKRKVRITVLEQFNCTDILRKFTPLDYQFT